MVERREVVVVGGTGRVGAEVVRALARENTFERVVACSRDPRRARDVLRDAGPRVAFARADVAAPLPDALFDRAAVVVSCIEDPGVQVAAACARRGVDYVDVTASLSRIEALERLAEPAARTGARLVHGVGLAPGVTNLLVARARARDPDVDRVRIVVSLGLGDDHGDAAIEWVFELAGRSFVRALPSGVARVRNFARAPDVTFLGERRPRGALALDFADQHTIARAAPGLDVRTDVTFDPPFVVPLARALASETVAAALAWRPLRARLTRAMHAVHAGPDTWVVHVESRGRERRVQQASGRAQSTATGRVAAHVARSLASAPAPAGSGGAVSIEAIVPDREVETLLGSIGARLEEAAG